MDALTAAHAKCLRGPGALDMPPDADACIDLPDDVECAIASFPVPIRRDAVARFIWRAFVLRAVAAGRMFEYLSRFRRLRQP